MKANYFIWLITLAVAAAGASLSAQTAQQPVPTNSRADRVVAPPPLPAVPDKAPVARFRELLAMNLAQRKVFLASRPAEYRHLIEQKLQEYESLSPEDCELRLRITELRYYLWPLLSTSPTNRAPQLKVVPDELRPMIELRLRSWDELAPDKQRQLLENEAAVRYFAELASNGATNVALTSLSDPQRAALLGSIAKWNQLSPSERSAIANRFEQFFGLNEQEKHETLSRLPAQERMQIQKTVEILAKLDPAKRAQCFRALNKLTGLPPSERDEFLKNAERWKKLTPEERKAWRNLVVNLSNEPPLPPGLARPPLPPPPRPPVPNIPVGTKKIATND